MIGKYDILYEIDEKSDLDKCVKPNGVFEDFVLSNVNMFRKGVFIDVGANAGYYSLVFSKLGFNSFAFEPNSLVFRKLLRNVEINGLDVKCLQVAVQDKSNVDTMPFYIRACGEESVNDGLSSLCNIELHKVCELVVRTTTIDKYFQNVDDISFIKIDTEGFDYNVLLGALGVIEKNLPAIQYEHSRVLDSITKNNCAKNCFDLIRELGYKQYFVDHGGDIEEMKEFSYKEYANILCLTEGEP